MKTSKILLLLFAIVSSIHFSPIEVTAQSAKILPNYYYRLTTQWQGDNKSLDIVSGGQNDKLILAQTGNDDGQLWKLTPVGNGYYRLTTKAQGDGKSLDILNDNHKNRPILANTGNYSGQMWKLTPMNNGYYRLTTQWQGDGKSLDIINDNTKNKPILANTGNYSGQMWKLSQVRPIQTKPGRTVRNSPPQTSRQEMNEALINKRQKSAEEMHQKRTQHNQRIREQQGAQRTSANMIPAGTLLNIKLRPRYVYHAEENRSNAELIEPVMINGNMLIPAGTGVSVNIQYADANFNPEFGGTTNAQLRILSVNLDSGKTFPVEAQPTLINAYDFPADARISYGQVDVPLERSIQFNLTKNLSLDK